MEHQHTFIILLFLFCSPWLSAGTTFLTHLGTQCEEDCKPDGGEYKCKTIDEDGRSKTLYCSPQENNKNIIKSGEVTHITSQHRNKRDRVVIDTVDDKANRLKITFYAEEAKITEAKKWNKEAEDLINQWNSGRLSKKPKSEMIKTEHLRIDMQNSFTHDKQLYYNLQIQINMKRKKPKDSTTVSQIIVPDGIPDEYIRRVFRESFSSQKKITVEFSKY